MYLRVFLYTVIGCAGWRVSKKAYKRKCVYYIKQARVRRRKLLFHVGLGVHFCHTSTIIMIGANITEISIRG